MALESGGGGGTSSSNDEEEEEQQRRSRTTGITSGSGDVVTEPVVDEDTGGTAGTDTGGGRGITSGGGDITTEPTDTGGGSGGGGGDTGTGGEETEPTGGDASPDASGGGGSGGDVTTDPGGLSPREAAGKIVDTTLQEGIERGGMGRTHATDINNQAAVLENRFIDQSDHADDPSDVVVLREGDRLVATLSRSARIDVVASDIETFVEDVTTRNPDRVFSGTERVPVGVELETTDVVLDVSEEGGVEAGFDEDTQRDIELQQRDGAVTLTADPEGEVSDEEIQQAEEELETTEATIPVPDTVTLFGPGMQTAEVPVPFDDITLSGQTRDVEIEQTESGDGPEFEVTQQERFGDFDLTIPEEGPPLFNAPLNPVGFAVGEAISRRFGGREFEDVTGAAGDRLASAGDTAGDVVSREIIEERTLLPGSIVEEQLTGDTEITEGLTRGVFSGTGNLAGDIINLPQEAAELGVEGGGAVASDVRSGEIDETSELAAGVGSAGVGAAILAGREAQRNPAEFAGSIAGTVALTGGAIGLAGRLGGPTVGRAVSVAVQPGEELGLAVGSRVPGVGRALARTPGTGIREGHLRGAAAEADGGSGRTLTAESRIPELNVRQRIAASTPSVRVEADPEAPLLNVDPALGEQARRAATAPARRGRQAAETVVETARGGAIEAAQRVGRARGRLAETEFVSDVETGRFEPTDVSTPGITGRAPGLRSLRQRVPESEFLAATETGRVDLTDVGGGGVNVPRRLPALRGRLPESEFVSDVETGRLDIGDVGGGLKRPSFDVGLATPDSPFLAATGTTRFDVAGVEAPSVPSGPGVRAGVRGGLERAGEGIDDFILGAQRGPAVTGDVALQQAFIRGSDLPFPTLGQATRTGRRRARQVSDFADDVGRGVARRAPPHRADITLHQAAFGDVELSRPSTPTFDVPAVGTALRRETTAARFRVAETAEAGRELAGDLGDLTIRVGDPPRTTLLETDTDDGHPVTPDEDLGPVFETDTDDTSATEPDVGGDEPLDPTRTGVGIETEIGDPAMGQRLRIRSETEADPESAVEPSVRAEPERNLRTETDPAVRFEPSVETAQTTELDVLTEPGTTTEPLERLDTRIGPRLETGIESRTETRTEPRTELGQETRTETRQELRGELTTEVTTELRTELDTPEHLRDDLGDDRRRRGGDAFTKTFEWGIATPEEVLEGEDLPGSGGSSSGESDLLDDTDLF